MGIVRSEWLVMVVTKGEIKGMCLSSGWRTAWIDDVRPWPVGGLPAACRLRGCSNISTALRGLWLSKRERERASLVY